MLVGAIDGSSELVGMNEATRESSMYVAPVVPVTEVAAHQEEMNSLKDMLSRPRLLPSLSNSSWTMATNTQELVSAKFLLEREVLNMTKSFYELLSCTMCLRVTIQSSAMDQGMCVLLWDPRPTGVNGGTTNPTVENASWFHHQVLDLRERNSVVLKAPWSHLTRRVTSTDTELTGKFIVKPIVPVEGSVTGANCSLRIQYWYEDVVLGIPRAQSAIEFGTESESGMRMWPEEQVGVEALVTTPTIASILTFNSTHSFGAQLARLTATTGDSRLAKVASGVDKFRCDVVWQFLAVKTTFHRGVLAVTGTGTLPDGTDVGRKGGEWDLGKQSTFCVRVPYFARSLAGPNDFGGVTLSVLNALEAPENVKTNIKIVAYVHAENFRVMNPEAQGWSLKCEEGVVDLVMPENKLPIVGKTLEEWLRVEQRLGLVPDEADGNVLVRPFQFDVMTATKRSFAGFLSRFFAFYHGSARVRIKVGLAMVDNRQGASTQFFWHSAFHGGVSVNCNYKGENHSADVSIGSLNEFGHYRLASSGDVIETVVHSDPSYLNPFLTQQTEQPTLVVAAERNSWSTVSNDAQFLFPRLIFSRTFDGQFYGMIPF